MSLSNCVKTILCGLSAATRSALKTLVQGYVAQLEVLVTALEAKLIYLDLLTAPVNVLNSLAQQAIAEVKAGANIVPLDLIGSCIEIGDLNVSIQNNLDALLVDVNIVANDLERLLSFRDEVQAEINNLREVIALYNNVIDALDACVVVQAAFE